MQRLKQVTDKDGTTITFTYDIRGVPSSVQVGSDLTTAPRYSYSYNGHGDVVALGVRKRRRWLRGGSVPSALCIQCVSCGNARGVD